ncbi:hypothetical protein BHYA_0526g00020 [Botrytis hyacinthi]|uniref:Uncharacterized protein n=1 Tax=Botrytis hyacinthi TaxID=278943 RepID=A0A4Z1G7X9_9HELO|nr:hypothetical protein BHYA_0526g00020 [Botrytis hyacinthi]
MLEQIKERSLSELEDLMRGFVEQANSISDIQERNDFQEQENIQMQEMIQEKIQERIQAKEDSCRLGRLSILITRSSEFAAPQKCNRKVNNQRAEQEIELCEEVGSWEGSVYEPPSTFLRTLALVVETSATAAREPARLFATVKTSVFVPAKDPDAARLLAWQLRPRIEAHPATPLLEDQRGLLGMSNRTGVAAFSKMLPSFAPSPI